MRPSNRGRGSDFNAIAVFAGGWIGALVANRVAGPYLRLAFGLFVVVLGASLIFGAVRRLGWI